MGDITEQNLERLFAEVGDRLTQPAALYVLGGSALILLGSPRRTLDLDFVGSDLKSRAPDELQDTLTQVAAEMRVEIEAVPFDEFVPIPLGAGTRHQQFGQFGNLTVYIFDPYSIALSKIERGFKTDMDDVLFLGRRRIIAYAQLETIVQDALSRAAEFEMDAQAMHERLESLRGKF